MKPQGIRSLQSTRSGSTHLKHSRRSPCKSGHDSWPRNSEVETGPTCMRGLLHRRRRAIISIAANHKHTFSTMHIDVSRAYFHAKRSETCAGEWRTEGSSTLGKLEGEKRACMAHVESWGHQLELRSKNLSRPEGHNVSGTTHGDDFVVTGRTDRLADLKNNNIWLYTSKTKIIRH